MLDITTDPRTDAYGWTTTLNLADRFGLTLYDAAYLREVGNADARLNA